MARKMDLAKLRDGYAAALAVGADTWADQPASAPRRKTIAEDIFLRFVIGWETFLSEWFIGCVSHDTTQYRVTVEKRMQSWLTVEVARSDYGPNSRHRGVFPPPTLSLAKTPLVDEVRELLDPKRGNTEFATFSDLSRRANQELVASYASRVNTLAAAGADEIVDAAIGIRNALAHRSRRAVTIMNQRVAAFPSYPQQRKNHMSSDGIGAYLAARTSGGDVRLVMFKREFERVAR
jgi:hypothetical protein